jgi:hypothetical protein
MLIRKMVHVQGHYFIWECTSLYTKTVLHNDRQHSTHFSSTAECKHWFILVQCVAVNVRFLLTVFKEGAGNAFLQLADMYNLQPAHSLLVKLKLPHSPCFRFVSSARINIPEKYRIHVFRSGAWGGHNPQLIFLLQKKNAINDTWCSS